MIHYFAVMFRTQRCRFGRLTSFKSFPCGMSGSTSNQRWFIRKSAAKSSYIFTVHCIGLGGVGATKVASRSPIVG